MGRRRAEAQAARTTARETKLAAALVEIERGPVSCRCCLLGSGTGALYSNYGFDLLGAALANTGGKAYADLLKRSARLEGHRLQSARG
jgi:CubicO group peptidase (beta-lactamase class C family)